MSAFAVTFGSLDLPDADPTAMQAFLRGPDHAEQRWDFTVFRREQPRNVGRGGNARDRRRTRRWMARHTVTVRDAEARLGDAGPDGVTVQVVGWLA